MFYFWPRKLVAGRVVRPVPRADREVAEIACQSHSPTVSGHSDPIRGRRIII